LIASELIGYLEVALLAYWHFLNGLTTTVPNGHAVEIMRINRLIALTSSSQIKCLEEFTGYNAKLTKLLSGVSLASLENYVTVF
jgi:hypothetical protein